MDDGKKFWDKISGVYDIAMRKVSNGYAMIIQEICSTVDESMDVLELATGTGIFALKIANKVNSVTATDFSYRMLSKAKEKPCPDNVKFEYADACALDYANQSFDVVLIANALHIMPNPEKALDEIRRVLKPDGMLIATTFQDKKSKVGQFFSTIMAKIIGFPKNKQWNIDSYGQFLLDNDFVPIQLEVYKSSFPISYAVAKPKN